MSSERLKVLLIAPYFDRRTPGESWSTYKWIEGISAHCETTVLTCHGPTWSAEGSPAGDARVVNWTDPDLPGMRGRLAWEMKPGYVFFYFKARRWIKRALRRGESFHLVHQISPLALRYPSPAAGLGLKYVVGPLAGSLPNPPGFKEAAKEKLWFRKLRGLDRVRLRWDPWLKATYRDAAAVIGVAPYVRELLAPCAPRRFEIMSETGVEAIAETPVSPPERGEPLRLLFVGRVIRTKGILDGIRAVARAREAGANVRLDVIGEGDLLETCRHEVERLGLGEHVTFHGRLPREEVFTWYRRSHVFLFPSFREPSGNVVFEAMGQGLPVITSNVGGPGYVVDDTCGRRVEPDDPDTYAARLADSILDIARRPECVREYSRAALARMEHIALWPRKIDAMMKLYSALI